MSLTAGTRLGPYEIVARIGAGGMGEVYRARDTRLNRTVAIKVLPESIVHDAAARERFDREARTISQIDHPNICALYDVGVQDAHAYLVMQLLEGETLADRMTRGKLPVTEAVAIARQIGDALDAAHGRGIVHRDLKPGNVMLCSRTPSAPATVKLLDFGLAKEGVVSTDRSMSPTVLTAPHGMILGTAAYMAPEQARGQNVDKQADIWAFGCVLYEMLTGKPSFPGATVTDILAAVVRSEPDWSLLPSTTPAHLRKLLVRCLRKDPAVRLRDIGDAKLELDEPDVMIAAAPPSRSRSSRVYHGVWFAAGALMATVVAVTVVPRRSLPAPEQPPVVFERLTASVGLEESPALSPDGRSVAFVAVVDGYRQIWARLLAGGPALQLTRDPIQHEHPRWMADSAAIVYFTGDVKAGPEGTLWEIPALGGPPRRLAAATSDGDVSHDGKSIAVFQRAGDRTVLAILNRDGSSRGQAATFPASSLCSSPRWSPDDRSIAFQLTDSIQFDAAVTLVPASGGETRRIARSADLRGIAWTPDGSLVYSSSQGSTVLYPPIFNLRLVRQDGSGDRQLTFGDQSFVAPDVDAHGIVTASRVTSTSDIWKIPITGAPIENTRAASRITRQTAAAQVPSIGPDETELVYLSDNGGHGNLWIAATASGDIRQLTFERSEDVSIGVPVWSPVGGTITFVMTRPGSAGQWLINRDGSGLRQFVSGLWASWSPDGRWLYQTIQRDNTYILQKTAVDSAETQTVRTDDALAPSVGRDGTLYFVAPTRGTSGAWDWKARKARPETGSAIDLATLNGARLPVVDTNIHPILSPDERWLAQPLIDGATTNLWLISTADGSMRPVTDFSDRPVIIARRTSWSRDSRFIYAAVAEIDADLVVLKNLLPQEKVKK